MAKRKRSRQRNPVDQYLDFSLDVAKIGIAAGVTTQVLSKIKF